VVTGRKWTQQRLPYKLHKQQNLLRALIKLGRRSRILQKLLGFWSNHQSRKYSITRTMIWKWLNEVIIQVLREYLAKVLGAATIPIVMTSLPLQIRNHLLSMLLMQQWLPSTSSRGSLFQALQLHALSNQAHAWSVLLLEHQARMGYPLQQAMPWLELKDR
jgi:hypothetical protein